jgi:ABC-2 type transport system permease protein
MALLACAIGFVIRHTAGAIAAFVGILLVLPLIVSVLPSSVAQSFEKYLPSNLGLAMTLVTTRKTEFAGVLFTPWTATGLLVVYAGAAMALAGWLLVRRDA